MHNLKLLSWFKRLFSILERVLLKLTEPSRHSLTLSIVTDLPRTKSQLIAENALLRQQLIILHRQVNKPRFPQSERFWIVFLASRVRKWNDVLLILKPDTLLRWHRQGFRLFGNSNPVTVAGVRSRRQKPSP